MEPLPPSNSDAGEIIKTYSSCFIIFSLSGSKKSFASRSLKIVNLSVLI